MAQGAMGSQPVGLHGCKDHRENWWGLYLSGALLGGLVLQLPHAVLAGQAILGHPDLGQDAHLQHTEAVRGIANMKLILAAMPV